jgi:branched-chain amino acid transport system ATP-binding protein
MILAVDGLRVRIAGSHILQGVSFDVAPSGVTALLGRNGVGKTTTLKAILGLLPRAAQVDGSVSFDGTPIAGVPTYRIIQRGLGYVPEDRGIFAGLTVAENLRLAERRDQSGAATAGHVVQTADYERVHALFPELARRAKQRAGTLSGGQQQMLAIGRVLLNRNRLLLIDEPTKGLAPKVVGEVAEVLERVARTVPMLLVEQNLAVVRRLAEQAVVIAGGRVAYAGAADELLGSPDRTTSLLGVGRGAGH